MGFQCFRDDPDKYRKPDVSVVKAERLAGVDRRDGFMPIPADLVVEVLSPNDLAEDVAEKIDEYLGNGFPLIWVVQPRTRTTTIYRADGSVTLLHEGDEITADNVLPNFRCKVSEFFPPPA
jgi:Uma2 family endonuclease